jgi:hypothetical protein
LLVVNILLIESGAVFKQKVSCSQHFVLIVRKNNFWPEEEQEEEEEGG